jgi:hypothetical protein
MKTQKGIEMSDQGFFSEGQPAIIELYGHNVIAGFVTEEEHFGETMCRVDVPEVDGVQAFTKFFGGKAIYGVTPCNEATMLEAVRRFRVRPIAIYVLPDRQLPATLDDVEDEEDEW